MYNIRNPKYTEDGAIDCKLEHPKLGWVDFTCINNTGESEMQEIWNALQSMYISEYVPPSDLEARERWRAITSLSRTNFILACKRADILTTEESVQAAKGDWPESFADALDQPEIEIDPDEAQIIWAATTQIDRNHPLISAIQAYKQMSDEEVDTLFGYDN